MASVLHVHRWLRGGGGVGGSTLVSCLVRTATYISESLI